MCGAVNPDLISETTNSGCQSDDDCASCGCSTIYGGPSTGVCRYQFEDPNDPHSYICGIINGAYVCMKAKHKLCLCDD